MGCSKPDENQGTPKFSFFFFFKFHYFAFLDGIVYKALVKEQNEVELQGKAKGAEGHGDGRKEFGPVIVLKYKQNRSPKCALFTPTQDKAGTFLRKGLQHFSSKQRYAGTVCLCYRLQSCLFFSWCTYKSQYS